MSVETLYTREEVISAYDHLNECVDRGDYEGIKQCFTDDIVIGNVITKPLYGPEAGSLFYAALFVANAPNADILYRAFEGNRLTFKWRQYFYGNYGCPVQKHIYCDGFGELEYAGGGKFSNYYGTFNAVKFCWMMLRHMKFKPHLTEMQKSMRQARLESDRWERDN